YFQIGRGYGLAASGLLITPLMFGVFIASTVAGRLVTRRGTWKRYVVGGVALQASGVLLMSTVSATTALWIIGIFLFIAGIGQGAAMQTLVLAVQNTVRLENMGVASSAVAFFRTMGGASGVQILGALLSIHVSNLIATRLRDLGVSTDGQADVGEAGSLDLEALPAPVEEAVRSSYGDGMAIVFLTMAGLSLIGLLATSLMRNSLLRSTIDMEKTVRASEPDVSDEDGTDRPDG